MIGGGEGNQNTTTKKISVEVEAASKEHRHEFKSFDPMSAVDTEGELDLARLICQTQQICRDRQPRVWGCRHVLWSF